ncbi:phosphodiester glycosidase family protein, partial [Phascolarctobacterium faecium]
DRASVQQTLGNTVADKAEVVLGAGPMLVEDGKRNVRSVSEQIAGDIAYGRAPRTAIGVKKDGTVVILVADGRRTNSVGMTLDEVARYMIKLGAVSALNFDGGGSSEMVLNNKILNNPSDGNERAVSVGLGLFSKKN